MKITKLKGSNKRSGLCRLQIDGDMTIYTAEAMLEGFMPYINDYKDFELDLSSIDEIDTAGVQMLLQFNKKAKQSEKAVCMTAISQSVQDVLGVYHLNDRFEDPSATQH